MSAEKSSLWRPLPGDDAAKAFYYGRTPALVLDMLGVIIDLNAACRELLGEDVAGCRGQHFGYLVDRVRPKVKGELLPPHGTAMEPAHIRTICDVGTGTGIPTARLLELGKHVTAVSTNRAMLQKLRNRLGPGCGARLTVIEDSAENLPQLADAGYDGVSVLLAFFDMADPLSALREAQRLLKPGGVLIVTEPRACFDMDALMKASQKWLRDRGLLEELGEDWQRIETIAPLIQDKIHEIQTHTSATALQQGWHAEAILEILRRDGFANLTFRKSHLDNCATIKGEKPLRSS